MSFSARRLTWRTFWNFSLKCPKVQARRLRHQRLQWIAAVVACEWWVMWVDSVHRLEETEENNNMNISVMWSCSGAWFGQLCLGFFHFDAFCWSQFFTYFCCFVTLPWCLPFVVSSFEPCVAPRQHLLLEHWKTLHAGYVGCGHPPWEEEFGHSGRAAIKGGFWWWLAAEHWPLGWWIYLFGSRTLPKTNMASWKIPIFMLGFWGG